MRIALELNALVRSGCYGQKEDHAGRAWPSRCRFKNGSTPSAIGLYTCGSSVKPGPLQTDAAQVCLYQGIYCHNVCPQTLRLTITS
jgi:hypothetical protein